MTEISKYRIVGQCAVCMKELQNKSPIIWYCSSKCAEYGEMLDK